MKNSLRELYVRFNYNEETGFICNVPSFNANVHMSIGFDNKRKEFNIHFTDDNIKEEGKERRTFILIMSAFRFFLMVKRLVILHNCIHLEFIKKSKINPGKLKKNGFMIFHLPDSILETKLLHITRQGKHVKIRKNIDFTVLVDGFQSVTNIFLYSNKSFQAYKWKGEHLSFQGIIFKSNISEKLYFVPKKKYNKFLNQGAIDFYNYINRYPTPETLEFRKIAFNNLKHPYLNK
jgi:hypothetical protein